MSALPKSAGQAQVAPRTRALSVVEQRQRERAARRHGLYAKSSTESGLRSQKAGRILRRLQVLMADQGTPITEEMIPAARSWAEILVVAAEVFAAILSSLRRAEAPSPRLLESWASLQRTALLYAKEFGLTPRSAGELAELGLTAFDKKQRIRRQQQVDFDEAHKQWRAKYLVRSKR